LRERLFPLSVIVVFIAMVLLFLSVSFRTYLKICRYFVVRMFGTVWKLWDFMNKPGFLKLTQRFYFVCNMMVCDSWYTISRPPP